MKNRSMPADILLPHLNYQNVAEAAPSKPIQASPFSPADSKGNSAASYRRWSQIVSQ
jgi:hypothetical protein